jgi:hypothetical protein
MENSDAKEFLAKFYKGEKDGREENFTQRA